MLENRMLRTWRRSALLFAFLCGYGFFAYALVFTHGLNEEIGDRFARTVVIEINKSGDGTAQPQEVRRAVAKAILKHNQETADEGDSHLLAPKWRATISKIAQTGNLAEIPPAKPETSEGAIYLRGLGSLVPACWCLWAFCTAAWLRYREPQWPMPLTKHPRLWMLVTLPGLVWYIPRGGSCSIIESRELRRLILGTFSLGPYGGDTVVACDDIARYAGLEDNGEQFLKALCRFPGVVGVLREDETVRVLLYYAANNSHWRVIDMLVYWKEDGAMAFRFHVRHGEPLGGDPLRGLDVYITTPGLPAKAVLARVHRYFMPFVAGYIPFCDSMTTGPWRRMIRMLERGELPKEQSLLPEDQ